MSMTGTLSELILNKKALPRSLLIIATLRRLAPNKITPVQLIEGVPNRLK